MRSQKFVFTVSLKIIVLNFFNLTVNTFGADSVNRGLIVLESEVKVKVQIAENPTKPLELGDATRGWAVA